MKIKKIDLARYSIIFILRILYPKKREMKKIRAALTAWINLAVIITIADWVPECPSFFRI